MTSNSLEEAEKIIQALLDNKLIACATYLEKARSMYLWEGKVEKDYEIEVRMKAKASSFDQIVTVIQKLHSYDVPQIISVELSNISQKYRSWLDQTI